MGNVFNVAPMKVPQIAHTGKKLCKGYARLSLTVPYRQARGIP